MESKEKYKLDSIRLELNKYGENKGSYTGMIKFENGHNESFCFMIRPDMADDFIKLIASDISLASERLTNDLIYSFNF